MENALELRWRKASYSGNGGGSCVEVACNLPGIVAVRDSKDPQGPILTLPPDEWATLATRLRPTI